MMYQVPAVDGYDGGLLPLKHFIDFSQLRCLAGRWMAGCARTSQLSPISACSTAWGGLPGHGQDHRCLIDDVLFDRQFQPLIGGDDALDVAGYPKVSRRIP